MEIPDECPFCGFQPQVPQRDVKRGPELEVRDLYHHVQREHPGQVGQLPTYPGE